MGAWAPWTECNEPCGAGLQRRYRNLTQPMYGGAACPKYPGKVDFQVCWRFRNAPAIQLLWADMLIRVLPDDTLCKRLLSFHTC